MLREYVLLFCQERYYNNDFSQNDIIYILKKYGFFKSNEALVVYNDIINLNEIYIKSYYYHDYFDKHQNNSINTFIDAGYIPITLLEN